MSEALVTEVDGLKRKIDVIIERFHAVNIELEAAKQTFAENNEMIKSLRANVEERKKADAEAKAKKK